jgi:uncharacterized protein YbjT (DUF2867 family)
MVMPRSRSMSIRSRYCARIDRSSTTPVICSIRSARVDLPWSMWAMMQKLRIEHIIYMSIVGADRVPLPYYQAKVEAERQLQASGLGLTIQRATQFHELVLTVMRTQRAAPLLFVPDIPIQPVDLSAVAARLTSLIGQEPAGRAPDLGGPRVERFTDLAQQWQHHIDRKRRVVPVRLPGRTFAAYAQGGHLAPEGAATATPTFADFLGAGTV